MLGPRRDVHGGSVKGGSGGVEKIGPVAVGSGKGGVGTSTVAGLLASAGARRRLDTLLVDADPDFNSLPHLFQAGRYRGGLEAIRDPDTDLEDLLVPVRERLRLLSLGVLEEPARSTLSEGERRILQGRLATLYPAFELVVVDAGSRARSVLDTLGSGVETLLAVSRPDRISAAATHALIKVSLARFPATRVALLLNGAGAEEDRAIARLMEEAAQSFLDCPTTSLPPLPSSPEIEEMLRTGRSLLQVPWNAPVNQAADQALRRLADASASDGAERDSLPFPRPEIPS